MRGQIREALRWLGPQAILSLFSTCSPLSVEEAARSSQIGCTPPPSPKGSQGTRRPLRTTRIGELSATVNRPDQVGSGGASSTTTRSGRVGPGAGTARLAVRAGPGAVDAGTPPSLGQAGRPADGPGITYCVNPSRTRGRAVPVLHAGLRSSLGRLSLSRRQWVFADGAARAGSQPARRQPATRRGSRQRAPTQSESAALSWSSMLALRGPAVSRPGDNQRSDTGPVSWSSLLALRGPAVSRAGDNQRPDRDPVIAGRLSLSRRILAGPGTAGDWASPSQNWPVSHTHQRAPKCRAAQAGGPEG